jgi:hypothetical protein
LAVSTTQTEGLIFHWIYPEGAIYAGLSRPRSYAPFSEKRGVADELSKTSTLSKLLKDWIQRRYNNHLVFLDFIN